MCFCFCKQKTAYEMRISDWSSDVCSSDLGAGPYRGARIGYSGRDDSVLAGAGWAAEAGPWQAMLSLARREGSESENSADDPLRQANPADTLRQSAQISRASGRERVC